MSGGNLTNRGDVASELPFLGRELHVYRSLSRGGGARGGGRGGIPKIRGRGLIIETSDFGRNYIAGGIWGSYSIMYLSHHTVYEALTHRLRLIKY